MGHDAYICYDKENKDVGDVLYGVFEENGINSWIKSKHFSSDDNVDKITSAIENSKCFVLILSKHSKDTNYIITETDIAFSRNIPIVVFSIDESKVEASLEFILENQILVNSYPYPKRQLEKLVRKVCEIISKPIDNVKLDSKHVDVFKKINPKKRENNIEKYIKIAVPIAIALVLIYLFVIVPTGQNTTSDGVFSMNVTKVDVNGLDYVVHGQSFNLPSDSANYIMNLKFMDDNDNLVYEVNSTADEFKSGVIWKGDLPNNDATHIKFKLSDLRGNELSKQDYVING